MTEYYILKDKTTGAIRATAKITKTLCYVRTETKKGIKEIKMQEMFFEPIKKAFKLTKTTQSMFLVVGNKKLNSLL
jgi:hypothetical protein